MFGQMGPCGMMGSMRGMMREEMVRSLICSMAKAGDSKKQIARNVRVAMEYADRIGEEDMERRRKEALAEELRKAAGGVSNAEANVERAREDLVRRRKEYKKLLETDPKSAGNGSELLYCLEMAEKALPSWEKTLEEKKKRLVEARAAAKKAGLKLRE